jgi:hypothetical protein
MFYLLVHSQQSGWVAREPLLPMLCTIYGHLIAFSEQAADVVYKYSFGRTILAGRGSLAPARL